MENNHNKKGYYAAKRYLGAAWDFLKKRITSAKQEHYECRPYTNDDTDNSIIFAISCIDMAIEDKDFGALFTAKKYLKAYREE